MSIQRLRSVAAALAAAFCAVVPAPAMGGVVPLSPLERSFLYAINHTRVEHGVNRVVINDTLVAAARAHSSDMVRRHYFAHRVFWRRLEQFGLTSGRVGEDLGWDSHLEIAVPELIRMWLRSQPHRAVLLNPNYQDVGVGVRIGPFAGYRKAIVVTADFLGPLQNGDDEGNR